MISTCLPSPAGNGGATRDPAGDGARHATGWLDPTEPFLADHRPGGQPLLGTVGSLEILARLIATAEPGLPIDAIEDVEAIRPVVFARDAPRQVTARWSVAGGAGAGRRVAAELSTDGDDGRVVHARAVFVSDPAAPREPHRAAPPGGLSTEAIDADEVYRVFFHGPTFRVIAHARLCGATVVTELAAPLPSWSTVPAPTLVAPRLIEFGLQTAGLLQLALDGAMMIPRHIRRIDRTRRTDVDHPARLTAIASRAGPGAADPIDVRIVDDAGSVHLAIAGYRCVPLPFATDDSRLSSLADRLRHSASGSTNHD